MSQSTITAALQRACASSPDAVAVSDPSGRWTYRELEDATRRVAAWLQRAGVGAGERVVLRLGNRRETVALLLGAMGHGAIAVPLNTEMKAYHLTAVLADSEPVVVIGEGEDVATLAGAVEDSGTACRVHDLADVWAEIDSVALAPDAPAAAPDPDSLALLIYTSGSTSAPKAVMSPHRTVAFAAEAIADRLHYRADDVVLTAIPLAFDYGLYQVFLSILAAAELQLADARFPVEVMRQLVTRPITVVPVVPSLAEMLITLAARRRPESARVRMFTNTGAAWTAPVIAGLRDAFPTAQIVPMYGITECKRVTILEPDGDLAKPGSVGRPLRGTQVLIKDDDGAVLPAGRIGEITVQGPNVMAGYWRAPEITAQRFRTAENGEPILHTGDYGRLDEDGHLYFEGRRDDMFKRRGVRMSVVEIEAAATDVPGVVAAAVFAPVDGRDLTVVAVTSLPPRAVLDALAERLEPAKVPTVCVLRDALPLTPNGKTDRRALGDQLAAADSRPGQPRAA